jgi:hypothetical protein
MSFPSGYRKIVVGEKVYFWKVGDKNTEIRTQTGRSKRVLANWVMLGMSKTEYLTNRWTQGSDEFRIDGGCQCWKCDCDMPHLRSSHVVTPGVVAKIIATF